MQYHQLCKQVQVLQYKSLITSILLYVCDTWTLLSDTGRKKKDPGFRNQVPGEVLRISYLEHTTNDWVRRRVNFLVGPQEPLLATVKRRKLAWFGRVTRHDSLSKIILQDTLEGWRRCDRQRKNWMVNIKEWTSLPIPELLTTASCRKDLKRISAKLSLMSPRPPTRSMDSNELDIKREQKKPFKLLRRPNTL